MLQQTFRETRPGLINDHGSWAVEVKQILIHVIELKTVVWCMLPNKIVYQPGIHVLYLEVKMLQLDFLKKVLLRWSNVYKMFCLKT